MEKLDERNTPEYQEKVRNFKEAILQAGTIIDKKVDPRALDLFCNGIQASSESINFYNDFGEFANQLESESDRNNKQKAEATLKWLEENTKRFR